MKGGAFLLILIVFTILIFLAIFGVIGERRGAVHEQEQKIWHDKHLERNANRVVGDIYYVKDPRTGLCFAYNGNQLFTVPCDSIPPHLLTVAK